MAERLMIPCGAFAGKFCRSLSRFGIVMAHRARLRPPIGRTSRRAQGASPRDIPRQVLTAALFGRSYAKASSGGAPLDASLNCHDAALALGKCYTQARVGAYGDRDDGRALSSSAGAGGKGYYASEDLVLIDERQNANSLRELARVALSQCVSPRKAEKHADCWVCLFRSGRSRCCKGGMRHL